MTGKSLVAIIGALNAARVRYLVVGGLAVVAHGYLRYTADVDLVLDPDPESLKRAIAALAGLGYRPRAPVPFETFADPVNRASWRRDKGMLVFSIHSPDHAATEIDLFLDSPFDFDQAYSEAFSGEVAPGAVATFVSRPRLIAMKRAVGRPQDLSDVQKLEAGEAG